MPMNDPIGDWNTGADQHLKVIAPNGDILDLTNMTSFDPKPNVNKIQWDDYKGNPRSASTPKGWTCTFEVVRGNSQIDDMWGDIEDDWHDRREYKTGTVFHYVTESNGQSVYKYEDCTFTLEDAGSWGGDKEVRYKVSFDARRRRRVRG